MTIEGWRAGELQRKRQSHMPYKIKPEAGDFDLSMEEHLNAVNSRPDMGLTREGEDTKEKDIAEYKKEQLDKAIVLSPEALLKSMSNKKLEAKMTIADYVGGGSIFSKEQADYIKEVFNISSFELAKFIIDFKNKNNNGNKSDRWQYLVALGLNERNNNESK